MKRMIPCLIATTISIHPVIAQDFRKEIEELKAQNARQQQLIYKLSQKLESLASRIDSKPGSLDQLIQEGEMAQKKEETRVISMAPAKTNNIQVGAMLQFAVGTSSQRDGALGNLQQGDHDPKKRGFTNRGLELSLSGTVDPHWDAEAHLLYAYDELEGETRVEVEEAFFTSRDLGKGLQLEIGHMLTEFGRINPRHAHAWTFIDQPLIHSRVFGADGMRSPGVRMSYLLPGKNYREFHVGFQNPEGETMASFMANDEVYEEANPVGARPFTGGDVRGLSDMVNLLRYEQGFSWGRKGDLNLGLSYLNGPNATGPGADTKIKGLDLVYKKSWFSDSGDQKSFSIEGEYITRDMEVVGITGNGPNNPAPAAARTWPAAEIEDNGFFIQANTMVHKDFGYGLRYERAWANGGDTFDPIAGDPKRAKRSRLSPMLTFRLSEFSRLRLQYNRDRFDFLPTRNADSVWLAFDLSIGAHPFHKF